MRIPLSEMIIRPFVHWMIKFVSPQVDRQFVEQRQVEMGRRKQLGRRLPEQIKRRRDERSVPVCGDAGIADVERQRARPLVRIGFHPLAAVQDGDRTISEVVVEVCQSAADDAVGLVPRGAFAKDSFACAADKERPQ